MLSTVLRPSSKVGCFGTVPGLVGLLAMGAAVHTAAAEPADPQPEARVVRGTVRDKEGRGLAWVGIYCEDDPTRDFGTTVSGAGGRFEIQVPLEAEFTLSAMLWGVPIGAAKYDAQVRVRRQTGDLSLVVDRGLELRLRRENGAFQCEKGRDLAVLVVDTLKGPQRFEAALDEGKAAFRRIPRGRPWTLWIPWNSLTKGTLYETGPTLVDGERAVSLEPGKSVSARVMADPARYDAPYPPGSIRWERAFATRGPIEEEGGINQDGTLDFYPLASGIWKITARIYDRAKGGNLHASGDVGASDVPLELTPVPVRAK
jgi:hypothetical protein